ncbi:MAG: bifunctional diaminohydroxyphosphoribosylaminopyrimidine deaminase/5-amino-6-(5-phosphoribosylamino)uracil reductase RibD [Bacteroidetes bacterium]|nr:MAG: bifunctional diaminohydroxyphosphoribosylaminopyrimidine deaminase/5-amino-6-(5-phosphoribosylamino)uracil reductase RibD [Bacteroidota bacterium]REK07040.1 MAG: bifunctional diaminohydroxyphosphoribosylaminopyrimidine deaminase/5-amino-6-(5-phosphoribosylamino)uracil reductase RibD [Bacteroidota bacterium]REK33613.1 MAG: bifunctional diaminohydroxyphosphoribosylaminopyrimidine deaminase/5-amino-6-(5-phosphoribosylamino)uracil reductase RibD [Bacteroidota bacterium]
MNHELYMRRCLDLAKTGMGNVAPNPMVGAVLVHENKIIGEGWHQKYGALHAEVNAINDALSKFDEYTLRNSVLYVNLEPCSHTGKTPPCSRLIIEKKIPHIVIACSDPNPLVAGKGIQDLKSAGAEVTIGVLEKEAHHLNRRFITYHTKGRPYIILKFAQSADGFIASEKPTEKNRWISNEYSRTLVHKWRSEEGAILVGSRTAMLDNPHLGVRNWTGRNPLRVLYDRKLKVPKEYKILDGSISTLVFNEIKDEAIGQTEFIRLKTDSEHVKEILNSLQGRRIISLIVEGGSKTLQLFIESGLWDEARIFTSSININKGLKAPIVKGFVKEKLKVSDNTLEIINKIFIH